MSMKCACSRRREGWKHMLFVLMSDLVFRSLLPSACTDQNRRDPLHHGSIHDIKVGFFAL